MANQDTLDMKKPCPICGKLMEMDPDGGWCAFDEVYFGADELSDYDDDYGDDDAEGDFYQRTDVHTGDDDE